MLKYYVYGENKIVPGEDEALLMSWLQCANANISYNRREKSHKLVNCFDK
jgi:hypothetical protein